MLDRASAATDPKRPFVATAQLCDLSKLGVSEAFREAAFESEFWEAILGRRERIPRAVARLQRTFVFEKGCLRSRKQVPPLSRKHEPRTERSIVGNGKLV